MADTHINAFFAAVEEAHKAVLAAHAEWEAAKTRLEAKKKEVGYVETAVKHTEETALAEAEKVIQSGKGFFRDKKHKK